MYRKPTRPIFRYMKKRKTKNNYQEINKNVSQLIFNLCKFKISKISYLIRTGSCAYDSKSINPNNETYIVSLKKLNKIKSDKIN